MRLCEISKENTSFFHVFAPNLPLQRNLFVIWCELVSPSIVMFLNDWLWIDLPTNEKMLYTCKTQLFAKKHNKAKKFANLMCTLRPNRTLWILENPAKQARLQWSNPSEVETSTFITDTLPAKKFGWFYFSPKSVQKVSKIFKITGLCFFYERTLVEKLLEIRLTINFLTFPSAYL